jgi:hypothetical protein
VQIGKYSTVRTNLKLVAYAHCTVCKQSTRSAFLFSSSNLCPSFLSLGAWLLPLTCPLPTHLSTSFTLVAADIGREQNPLRVCRYHAGCLECMHCLAVVVEERTNSAVAWQPQIIVRRIPIFTLDCPTGLKPKPSSSWEPQFYVCRNTGLHLHSQACHMVLSEDSAVSITVF